MYFSTSVQVLIHVKCGS